jgi:hypothetical protein
MGPKKQKKWSNWNKQAEKTFKRPSFHHKKHNQIMKAREYTYMHVILTLTFIGILMFLMQPKNGWSKFFRKFSRSRHTISRKKEKLQNMERSNQLPNEYKDDDDDNNNNNNDRDNYDDDYEGNNDNYRNR